MIFETIVVTRSEIGAMHITPLGIREDDGLTLLAPYRPSTTLDNLLATRCASVALMSANATISTLFILA